ncbi:MAG: glycerol-3-phosphate 1-O-acyltransferase PlsY [Phycisphaerales bacterium]|nr:MAG: glycerol-3-phosphate 1-O-acyltransferase PlsY [Phycisphaerales bacterium]
MKYVILIVGAYLLGSIPFGLLIAKAHGKDLRSIGSGNIGATNVARALGRKWAYGCFLLDMLKGLVPILATMLLIRRWSTPADTGGVIHLWLWIAVGCAAILGHIFPIYVKFKGGKGVATSFGVALGLWPYFTACAFAAVVLWAVLVLIWRYVSLASIAASIAFPVFLVLAIALIPGRSFTDLWPLLVTAAAIPPVVIARHRKNIKRLIAGTEGKVLQRKRNGDK